MNVGLFQRYPNFQVDLRRESVRESAPDAHRISNIGSEGSIGGIGYSSQRGIFHSRALGPT